ncbi:MAG: signal peptide protein [Gemmatimonadales bacterium]|nr:signal peptide protein [Gemmatimonadales bacterium]
MTRTRMQLAIALGLIALGACAPATVNQATDAQTIRSLGNDWQRAVAARDVDRIVALHAPNAISMSSNSPAAIGSTAIRGMYAGLVNLPGLSLVWVPTSIDVVSPTVANEYGTYTMSFDGPQGKVNDRGNYTTIWHKIDGQWRVATDATVSSTPFPAAAGGSDISMDTPENQFVPASGIVWNDFSSPGFDPGVKIAVLHGNPAAKGDYVLRLRFPAEYKFPVHWHPGGEHLTVLWGTFMLGMGSTNDWTTVRTYSPGDFLYVPPRHPHFGGAGISVTVIQLHGEGPFQLFLGAPK